MQTSEYVHALRPLACLLGCESGKTIDIHWTSQSHHQAGNAPIAEGVHRSITHQAGAAQHLTDLRRFEASADLLNEGFSCSHSSALAGRTLFFSTAFWGAFTGCTFGSSSAFFSATFGRALASAALCCRSGLAFCSAVCVLCGSRKGQRGRSQCGQRGQFQTCLHFYSFRSGWINVRLLFASSTTKRACYVKTVRGLKIFSCRRTVFTESPLLEMSYTRRRP